MLLLYRSCVASSVSSPFQFTFHYASTLSCWRLLVVVSPCPIYIPLCFYFILVLVSSVPHCTQFTFHYASTLSFSEYRYSFDTAIFTFHYASTLSVIQAVIIYMLQDLHSTMLLLYQTLFDTCLPCTSIFTFHYASTLSLSIIFLIFALFYLHSTMLLLYLLCTTCRASCIQYLHSTMLLLYRISSWEHSVFLWIYIPLCFYFI